MWKKFLILFILLMLMGSVSASVGHDDKKALTEELMKRSGITDQIRQIPDYMLMGFPQASANTSQDPAVMNMLKEAMLSAADPHKILADMSQYMEKHLDVETIKTVTAWLNTDFGKKVTSLEEEAASVEAQKDKRDYAMQLKKSPPSKQRLLLARRLMEVTNSREIETDVALSVAIAPLRALNSVLPKEKHLGDEALKKTIGEIRRKALAASSEAGIMNNLYMYRTLTDSELQSYIKFLGSESGSKFYKVSLFAFKRAMTRVSDNLVASLGGAFSKILASRMGDSPAKVTVHMKNGQSLDWDNYTENDDQYCTWANGGLFCLNKNDVSSIGGN